jgi:hypothetical protein
MRNRLSIVILSLVLCILACNAPQTTTPRPVCTPPLCKENEVYYCPEACPGGCGTECATPTGMPPAEGPPITVSPTAVAPTDTPIIMCTPPLCGEDEVYYCRGECPGGCGTECVTPTPAEPTKPPPSPVPTYTPTSAPQSAPTIISFSADHTTIVEGESVNLSWYATGGTEAQIQWVTREAVMAYAPGPLDPNGGVITINPDGDGDIVLIVTNSLGSAEAHVQLTIECPHDWAPALDSPPALASGCPMEAVFSVAAQQSFENGFMIWLEAERSIYVFYDAPVGGYPTYGIFIDNYDEDDPESDPTIVPPPGLYQPVRGFGLLWRQDQSVRDRLGWATAPEAGFKTWMQGYSGIGMHNHYTLVEEIDGTVYQLRAMGSLWEIYAP